MNGFTSNLLTLGVLLSVYPAAAQSTASPGDSLRILVDASATMPVYIQHTDEFDNSSLLRRGINSVASPALLRDAHWQSEIIYPIGLPGSYRFVLDDSKRYWLLKTGNAQRDAALNFYVEYRKQVAPITKSGDSKIDGYPALALTNFTQRDSLLQADLMKQLSFLRSYSATHQLSDGQIKEWRTVLRYVMRHKQLFVGPKLMTPAYTKRLAQLAPAFTDDSALFMPPYQLAALQCAYMVAAHLTNTTKPTLTQRYDAALSAFSGRTRDFILTRLVLLGSGSLDFPPDPKPTDDEVSKTLVRYFVDCQSDRYKEYVRRATSLRSNDLSDGSLLTRTAQTVSFGQATTTALLTYVDFWASWCVPCREEMPHSKTLQAAYGQKGVRFLYVSLDKNPAAWEQAMHTIGLSDTDSYLLTKNYQSLVAKRFRLTTIPRYLLIAKDGRVISANAPRPGTAEIRRLLDASLSN